MEAIRHTKYSSAIPEIYENLKMGLSLTQTAQEIAQKTGEPFTGVRSFICENQDKIMNLDISSYSQKKRIVTNSGRLLVDPVKFTGGDIVLYKNRKLFKIDKADIPGVQGWIYWKDLKDFRALVIEHDKLRLDNKRKRKGKLIISQSERENNYLRMNQIFHKAKEFIL